MLEPGSYGWQWWEALSSWPTRLDVSGGLLLDQDCDMGCPKESDKTYLLRLITLVILLGRPSVSEGYKSSVV